MRVRWWSRSGRAGGVDHGSRGSPLSGDRSRRDGAQGRPALRRQVGRAGAARGGAGRGHEDRRRRGGRCPIPEGADGHRPGRRHALAGVHRRPHPPDGRVQRRLEPGVRQRIPPRGGRAGHRRRGERPGRRGGGLHHRPRRGERATSLDVGLRNSIARGLVPGPRMLVAVHTLGPRGGHADRNGIRHDLLREDGPAEGIAHGPGRVPRGGAVPGEVRRRRDQVLRLRRRALAGRRGGHAAADARGDVGPGRRGPPAAEEGGRPLPRRPGRPGTRSWPGWTRSSTARS